MYGFLCQRVLEKSKKKEHVKRSNDPKIQRVMSFNSREIPDGFEGLRYAGMAGELFQHLDTLLAELIIVNVDVCQVKGTFAADPTEEHGRVRRLDHVETGQVVVPRLFVC